MSAPHPARPGRGGGGLTGRAALLGLVLCVLALTLAYPLREYLSQRSLIAQQQRSVQQLQRQVDVLQGQRDQLDDPRYVEEQARGRLHFVRPGETTYLLVDPGDPQAPRSTRPSGTTPPEQTAPWYSQLLQSAAAAGR